jgi:hypothetical protein
MTRHKYSNENAMAFNGLMFGLFCLIIMVVGTLFVVSVNSNQTTYTDTYGNTLNPASNSSQNLVTSIATTGSSDVDLIILLGCAIGVIAVIFLFWVASKSWG